MSSLRGGEIITTNHSKLSTVHRVRPEVGSERSYSSCIQSIGAQIKKSQTTKGSRFGQV